MNQGDDIMGDLSGSIRIYKRLRKHPVWRREAFSYGQAWLDLLLLAVDRASAPQTIFVRKIPVVLQRGQVGWSQEGLAEQWRWGREKVAQFLKWCQGEGMIAVDSGPTGTVITILNYDAYQIDDPAANPTTDPAPDPAANPTTDPAPDPAANPTTDPAHKGKEVRERGKGKGESAPAKIPSDDEVGDFAIQFTDLSRGIQGMPEGWWRGWLASRLGSPAPFPSDWRRVVRLAFLADWVNQHPKAHAVSMTGPVPKKNAPAEPRPGQGGRSQAQAQFEWSRELEHVRERLDAYHETSTEPLASDVAREKELEGLIAGLGSTSV